MTDPFFSSFVGVLINGPEETVWPKGESLADYPPGPMGNTHGPLRLMIAGLANVKYSYMGLRGQCGYEVLLVAVNQITAQSYSGKMPEPEMDLIQDADLVRPDAPSRADYEEYRESLHSSTFNLDLVHDLGLPIADATYTVYATLGEYKSNVLTITTSVR